MRRVATGFAIVLLFLAPAAVHAHKGHASPSPTPTPAAPLASATPDAVAEPVDAVDPPAAAPEAAPARASLREVLAGIPWKDAATGHLHNKLVHFPLAFGLAAAVILLVGARWPAYAPAGRVLLVIAALVAVGAFFTGQAQMAPFVGSPLEDVLGLHRLMGLVTATSLWAGVLVTFVEKARPLRPVLGIWLLVVLSVTGFLGGVLSHS